MNPEAKVDFYRQAVAQLEQQSWVKEQEKLLIDSQLDAARVQLQMAQHETTPPDQVAAP